MIGGLRTKDQKRFYARMSRIPYKGDRLLRQAQLNRYGLNDWRQDEQLSTPDVSVLVNPKTKEVVTSFVGTREHNPRKIWKDLRSDAGIFFGTSRAGKRTTEAEKVAREAAAKYAGFDHTLTGHSLGGRVAENVSKATGIDSVAYNPGGSPAQWLTDKIASKLGADKEAERVAYHVPGDILSEFSRADHLVSPTASSKHALRNFGAGRQRGRGRKRTLRQLRARQPAD